ncbi:MAG: hypothetical protein KAW12_13640 [Candidatus Aminicenantes bacterium]|nr:hypothetical protein [Candidatus Aminicenantes bacterium]
MSKTQVNIPIEVIINLLRSLDVRAREQIFEEVFIECDTTPLSGEEEQALTIAEDEYKRGETISWNPG